MKILFSNQIRRVLEKRKKSELFHHTELITVCNITQSVTDTDFHFVTVDFALSVCAHASCEYAWACIKSTSLNLWKVKRMECDCWAFEGHIWQTSYTTGVFSLAGAIGNLQMQPNKEELKEQDKRKAKLELSVCTWVVPELSCSATRGGGSVSLPMCHCCSISPVLYLCSCVSLGQKWLGRTQLHRCSRSQEGERGDRWACADSVELKPVDWEATYTYGCRLSCCSFVWMPKRSSTRWQTLRAIHLALPTAAVILSLWLFTWRL